jgi:hypothetical protein
VWTTFWSFGSSSISASRAARERRVCKINIAAFDRRIMPHGQPARPHHCGGAQLGIPPEAIGDDAGTLRVEKELVVGQLAEWLTIETYKNRVQPLLHAVSRAAIQRTLGIRPTLCKEDCNGCGYSARAALGPVGGIGGRE